MSVGSIIAYRRKGPDLPARFRPAGIHRVLMQPVMRPCGARRVTRHRCRRLFRRQLLGGPAHHQPVFLAGTQCEKPSSSPPASTVSAAFMIIVAKTLNLMGHWNFYFWSTPVITFVITAILARVSPISRLAHHGETDEPLPDGMSRWQAALTCGLTQSHQADPCCGN